MILRFRVVVTLSDHTYLMEFRGALHEITRKSHSEVDGNDPII